MRSWLLASLHTYRTTRTARIATGKRRRGCVRRIRTGIAGALVCSLALTMAPASPTYAASSTAGGGGQGLTSWLGSSASRFVGAARGPQPRDPQGELRPGADWSPPGRAGAPVVAAEPKPPGRRTKELTDRRTATRTVFQLDDGRLQTELSSVPVRYRDTKGVWRDIDTRLTRTSNGYANDGTGFTTRFAGRSDRLVEIRLGDRTLAIGVAGDARQIAPTVRGSTVRYAGVWDGADLVYDLTPTGVAKSIVLSRPPATGTSFAFTVRAGGVEPRTLPDGSIGFFATGPGTGTQPVFSVPKPFMTDAQEDASSPHGQTHSDKVEMTVTRQGSTSRIIIKPDQAWLAAKDRRYPVVVDPTITVQPDVSTSKDAMIVSYAATSNYGTDPRLGVGVDRWGRIRSLVQFNLAGIVPPGTPVDAADLALYWDNTVLSGTTTTPVALEARAVTQSWTPSTVTWNSINAAAGDIAGSASFSATQTNTWTTFPVTGIVRDWVAGTRPNHGFMLKAANETQVAGGPIFWAGEFPVSPVGEWPTYTTRTAPRLTLTFGQPAVRLADPTTVRATGAQLSWSAYADPSPTSGDDLVEYQVHRSTVADFAPSAATLVAPLPEGTTSYSDTTATPNTTLHYRVVVLRKDGQRPASQSLAVKTPPAGYVDASLPTVADTTLTTCDYTQPHNLLNGRPNTGVGYVPGGYGTTRALIKWDISQIPPTARVVEAHGRLWRTMYNGNAVYYATHALTRAFDPATATWLNASAGTPWTWPGGDAVSSPIEVFGLVPTANAVWVNLNLTTQVQSWKASPSTNHGVLLRVVQEPNKACPGSGEGAVFVSSESAEPSVVPRLHVRYTDTTVTYYAAATPVRLNVGETIAVPVTVTNTTSQAWPAASTRLGYWWKRPDGTDATTADNQLLTALPSDLAPGQTVTVNAQVKAPALSGDGNRAEGYTLAWDLYDTATNNWKSSSHQLPQLPQQIRIEDPTSDLLGLEKFYSYTGKATGAGGSLLVNSYAGNAVWTYNAFTNPSRGQQTFVRMSYNSLDTSASSMGFGWSLQTSTVQRLGSQLSFHPPGQQWPSQVRATDGDGTTNVWVLDTHGRDVRDCTPSTCDYVHPRGVHLYLQQTGAADPTRTWVFTKPDRTQFFFDDEGFQSSIVDKNGNTMSFVYERRRSNNKPTKFLKYITDAAGRRTLTVDYYAKGDPYTYVDDDTWQEVEATNLTNPFIIDNIRSLTDIADRRITFTYTGKGLMAKMVDGAGSAQPKVFRFRYDATQGNKNVKLVRVTDPRGHDTNLRYYTAPVDPQNKWKLQDITDRIGGVTRFDYVDPDGPQGGKIHTTAVDPLQHSTNFVLDAFGRPESVTNAKNQTMTVQWDADHNVTRLTEPNSAFQTWVYDSKTGYPLTIKTAEANKNGWPGTTLSYTTTLNGYVADLVEKASSEGRLWQFGYDVKGNLKTVTDPLGVASPTAGDYTTTYEYDALGQPTRIIDANNHATRNGDFDANGYPRTITDALQNVTTFLYDPRGLVTEVTDALGIKTTQAYDIFKRPLARTVPKDQAASVFITTPAPLYDPNDNIVKETAPNGAVTEAVFDAADRVTYTLDPKDEDGDPERKTLFTYDLVGNELTLTEPKGNLTPEAGDYTTTSVYNEIYQLVEVRSADGNKITASYDDVGNLATLVDARKNATPDQSDYTEKRTYDLDHRVIVSTDAKGHTERREYDRDGLMVATTDQEGSRSTVAYNARGDEIERKVPHKNDNGTIVYHTTSFEYDQVGNQTKVITPRGVATSTADDFTFQTVYDELDRVKEEWAPYDPADSRYNTPDKTIYHYDAVSRVTTVSAPPSSGESVRNDTKYTYWDTGWTKTSADPWDIVTSYDYNVLGLQTQNKLISAGGCSPTPTACTTRTMGWDFYPSGNLKSRSDEGLPVGRHVVLVDNSDFNNAVAAGAWSATSNGTGFQGHNYQTSTAGSGGDTFTWNLVIPQDGSYDVYVKYPTVSGAASNAPFTVAHSGGSTIKPVDQTTAGGTWVSLGRFAFTAGGPGQKVTLTDNANGTVVADAVKLVRDNGGEADNEEKDFAYTYDPNGNLVRVADNSPDARIDAYVTTYDELNRVATVEEMVGTTAENASSFTYDENSNLKTRTHDSTWSLFEYDERDLLAKVTNAASASATPRRETTYAYTPRGLAERQVKPNGNTVEFSYYLDGAVQHQVERRAGGALVAEHTLEYTLNGDPAKDIARLMNADNSSAYVDNTYTFTYDPRDRIARVDKAGADAAVETYRHDANSNVIQQTVKNVTTNHNYDRNRLMTSSAVGGLVSAYNYDPLGRLDTVTTSGVVIEKYRYDGFDRIAELRTGTGASSKTTRYIYDPFDRTASEKTNAGGADEKTTIFHHLGTSSDVLSEEVDEEITKSYEYSATGQKLSQLKRKDDGTQEISHYTYHPKGDVEAVTKHEDGTTRATYGYTAYGDNDHTKFTGVDKPDPENPEAEPYNAYRFNGHRWDEASDTYDMGFRNYDPGLNQFLTRDMYNGALDDLTLAIDPFSGSRYAFAGGNPISNVELDGHGFWGAVKNFASGVVDHIKEDPLQFIGEVAIGVAAAAAVGAVCATGVGCVILAGAAAGAAAAGYGYSVDAAQGEHDWNVGDFSKEVVVGGLIGGATGGLLYGGGKLIRPGLNKLRGGSTGRPAAPPPPRTASPHGGAPEPAATPAPPPPKPPAAPAKPAAAPAKPSPSGGSTGTQPVVGSGNAYSVAYETRLPRSAYPGRSRGHHFKEANRNLAAAMDADPAFGQLMESMIPGLRKAIVGPRGGISRRSPTSLGWTWHHHVDPGRMQLVPTVQHEAGGALQRLFHPGGVGGFSIWG